MRGVKRLSGTKGRDQYAHTLGGNAADPLGEKSKITGTDRNLLNGEEWLGFGAAVVENNSFDDAAGSREITLMKGANDDLAVAGLSQVLKHPSLRQKPLPTRSPGDCTQPAQAPTSMH